MSCFICTALADQHSALPYSPLTESLEDMPLTAEVAVPEELTDLPFQGHHTCPCCGARWWQFDDLAYRRRWREVSGEAYYRLLLGQYAVVQLDTGQLVPLLPDDSIVQTLAHAI